MIEWEIKREPWAEPEWQAAYGDAATIEITNGGKSSCAISVAEVIDAVGLRYTIAHALECVRQGHEIPEDVGNMAGEIAAYAAARRNKPRKRK